MCSCEQGTCPGGCDCGCAHTPPVPWAAEVRKIALRATAHNSGSTIVSFYLLDIEEVDDLDQELGLQMSSWPRMQEAKVALQSAGYDVDEAEDTSNTLWVSLGANAPPKDRDPETVEEWLAR